MRECVREGSVHLDAAALLPEERDGAAQLEERADARARRQQLLALHEVGAVAVRVHAAHVEPRACRQSIQIGLVSVLY
jgi:hypothetical protein